MNEAYRPPRYYKPISPLWWLRRRSYLVFALRELTCLFVAWFVVYLLLLIRAVNAGQVYYRQFLSESGNPWLLLLNVIALLFLILHSITWFNQTPQAIVVRVRGRRVARTWIVAAIYLLWVMLSAGAACVILGVQ